jgi:hypothetical protein
VKDPNGSGHIIGGREGYGLGCASRIDKKICSESPHEANLHSYLTCDKCGPFSIVS